MKEEQKGTFAKLNSIDCNKHTEKKNGLTYLSWAWAWDIVKTNFPDANYEVVLFDNLPYLHDFNLGYLVQTKVTINGETIQMQLPVMDGANKAQKSQQYTYKGFAWEKGQKVSVDKKVEPATMFDINTAIMRCLTKNLAMFGLGLYIYRGEDIPTQVEEVEEPVQPKESVVKPNIVAPKPKAKDVVKEETQAPIDVPVEEVIPAKKETIEQADFLSLMNTSVADITKRKEQEKRASVLFNALYNKFSLNAEQIKYMREVKAQFVGK